jgi:hypothetical protein
MRVGLPFVSMTMVIASFGCSKSPERVCDHLVEMARKQFGDLEDEKMRDQAMKTCVDDKRAMKANDPKKYECFSDCVIDVRLLAEAADCETKCGVALKKTIEDDEPTDGIPGLWVDPYADAKDDAIDNAIDAAIDSAIGGSIDGSTQDSSDAHDARAKE